MYDREEKTQFGTKRRIFSGVVVKDTSQGRGARTDFTSNADFGEQDVPKNEIAPSKPKSIIDGDKGQDGGTNSNSTSNDNNNAGNGSSTTTNVNLAKNEALQILCAVLLTEEVVTIENIPDIKDVNLLIDLLDGMGVEIEKLTQIHIHSKLLQSI